MKKFLSVVLAIVMASTLVSVPVLAAEERPHVIVGGEYFHASHSTGIDGGTIAFYFNETDFISFAHPIQIEIPKKFVWANNFPKKSVAHKPLVQIAQGVSKNKYGIVGRLLAPKKAEYTPIAFPQEIKTGEAIVRTSLNGTINDYTIKITGRLGGNIKFEMIDPDFLANSKELLTGMSGSPILQNGRIVGAVAYRDFDNVLIGYGEYAYSMYKAVA